MTTYISDLLTLNISVKVLWCFCPLPELALHIFPTCAYQPVKQIISCHLWCSNMESKVIL